MSSTNQRTQDEYSSHFDGQCKIPAILSLFAKYVVPHYSTLDVPEGYAKGKELGPRVYKNDWWPLLQKLKPLLIFDIINICIAGFGLLWLLVRCLGWCMREADKCETNTQKTCRQCNTLVLFICLISLGAGIYFAYGSCAELNQNTNTDYRNYHNKVIQNYLRDTATAVDNHIAANFARCKKKFYNALSEVNTSLLETKIENDHHDFSHNIKLKSNEHDMKNQIHKITTLIIEFLNGAANFDDGLRYIFRHCSDEFRHYSNAQEKLIEWNYKNFTREHTFTSYAYRGYRAALDIGGIIDVLRNGYDELANVQAQCNNIYDTLMDQYSRQVNEYTSTVEAQVNNISTAIYKVMRPGFQRHGDSTTRNRQVKLLHHIYLLACATVALSLVIFILLCFVVCCGVFGKRAGHASLFHKGVAENFLLLAISFSIFTLPFMSVTTSLSLMIATIMHSDICHTNETVIRGDEDIPRCTPSGSIYDDLLRRHQILPLTANVPPEITKLLQSTQLKIKNLPTAQDIAYNSSASRRIWHNAMTDGQLIAKVGGETISKIPLFMLNEHYNEIHWFTKRDLQSRSKEMTLCFLSFAHRYLVLNQGSEELLALSKKLDATTAELKHTYGKDFGYFLEAVHEENIKYMEFFIGPLQHAMLRSIDNISKLLNSNFVRCIEQSRSAMKASTNLCDGLREAHWTHVGSFCLCREEALFSFPISCLLIAPSLALAMLVGIPLVTLYGKPCSCDHPELCPNIHGPEEKQELTDANAKAAAAAPTSVAE